MKSEGLSKIGFLAISAVIHATVLADFWWGDINYDAPAFWNRQFTIVLMMMFLLSSMTIFVKHFIKEILIWAYLFIAIIISIPFLDNAGSYSLIFGYLAFEAILYLKRVESLIIALCSIILPMILTFSHIPIWNETTPRAIMLGSVIFPCSIWLLSIVIALNLLKKQISRERLLNDLNDLYEANIVIANTNIRLQEIAVHSETSTMVKERTRLAREIHDTIAYTLTNILSFLDVYHEKIQTDGLQTPMEIIQARSLTRDGFEDVRQVLRGLRPKEKEGDNGLGNIGRLVEVFAEATAVKVELSYGDAPQFPGADLEDTFYRVAQEGLTNAFRHGRATEIFISFHRWLSGIELTVRDNGRGSDDPTTASGFGLMGIKERAEALGGNMTTAAQPGLGFTLRVWLPYYEQTGDEDADRDR